MTGPLKFLDIEQIYSIHEWALMQHGGGQGVLNRSSIESAVEAPKNYWAYELESPRKITTKQISALAGCYWFHFTTNHAFVDGNKRVGFTAAKLFLLVNGYSFKMPNNTSVKLTLAIAEAKLSREELMLKVWPHIRVFYG